MSAQSIRLLDLDTLDSSSTCGGLADLDGPACQASRVTVSTGDVLPLLVDAALTNRAWLDDFADDTLDIPQDLYEVLLAYRNYRQRAA